MNEVFRMKRLRSKILGYLCIMSMLLLVTGCGNSGDNEEVDPGAAEKGTVYFNDYRIDIEGPRVGHPSNDALWSTTTTYGNEEEKDVNVEIYGKEGSLADRIDELTAEEIAVTKGILWGNDCHFYIQKATIALIPLGDTAYLQVELHRNGEPLEEGIRVPTNFKLHIEKKRQ